MTLRPARPSAHMAVLIIVLMVASFTASGQGGYRNPGKDEQKVNAPAKEAKDAASVEVQKFPKADRESPSQLATKKGAKSLQEIVQLFEAKNYPETFTRTDALVAATDNAYERSFASQVAAAAASQAGDAPKAITYFKQAIDGNGLDNNSHYVLMYNLAVTQYEAKQYAEALSSIDRLLKETKSDAPEYVALRGSLLGRLERPAEAAAVFEQLYMRDPSDRKSLMNAVALYQQAKNVKKADALLAGAQDKGQLTDPNAYRMLYVGYINAGKLQDAISTIDEGLAKGIVRPSPDLVNVYAVIAQTAYDAGDIKRAIDMYGRAATISTDGEQGLNLAKVLLNEGRTLEAKKAAQQALAKGLKNPAEAQRIIAAAGK